MTVPMQIPKEIRVSLGSAIALGLLTGKLDATPTTAYLMTYKKGKCTANCGFCPQARESQSRADMLSRVSWPIFSTKSVLNGIGNAVENRKLRRVCFQALNYLETFEHLTAFIRAIRTRVNVPVSVSCQPKNRENIEALNEAGAERIGISLDAANEEIFDKVKGLSAGGPYRWEKQFQLLSDAVNVFGKGKVSTHLIVGLGETEKEMIETIQQCVDMSVLPALFAFTPISGTSLERLLQPPIKVYRRVQVARHLMVHEVVRCENMRFDEEGIINDFGVDNETLLQIIRTGEPFRTSGCPNCNRPYYNEKPGGILYNYPKDLTEKDFSSILKQLGLKDA